MVLGAGFGKRLLPLTEHLPKVLIPYLGAPMISYNLEKVSKFKPEKIFVNGHYQAHKLQNFLEGLHLDTSFMHEATILGTAGTILKVLKESSCDNTLVANGDIICDLDYNALIEHHYKSNAIVTMAYRPHNLVSNPVYFQNGGLLHIGENKSIDPILKRSFCGIYVVNKRLLNYFKPDDFDIVNVFKRCYEDIYGVEHLGFWQDLGSHSDYLNAQDLGLKNQKIRSLAHDIWGWDIWNEKKG